MKYHIVLLALLAGVCGARAQNNQPLPVQFGGGIPGVEVRLPVVSGWTDGTHYIERRFEDRRILAYAVDVVTGDTVRHTMEQKSALPAVKTVGGDITYILPSGAKKLTTTAAVEENPVLSPDGKWVAFTRDNDLYAIELASGREVRYTTDGSDVIGNGYASWVYYEEILGRGSNYRSFWWSPDSRHIAFFRSDDTPVPVFPIYNSRGQHGYVEYTCYPKAGDPNPEVSVGIVAVEGGSVVWADFNPKNDQYFGQPFWRPDGSGLLVQWMPRGQDNLKFYDVAPDSGTKKLLYDEKQPTWIDWITELHWMKEGFLMIRDFDGWEQIYYHNNDGSLRQKLTHGRKWKTEIVKIDEDAKVVFFTSCGEISTRTDLYRVRLDGKEQRRLTFGEYTHKNISISPDNSHFITFYENVTTPTRMVAVNVKTGDIRVIADSRGPAFDASRLSRSEILWITTPEGFRLPAHVSWPLPMEEGKKYPVMVQVYGGPNAGTVTERWTPARFKQESPYIRIAIDHRGSGHCGKVGMNYMHRNLGKWEMEDYITWVKHLHAYPCVDTSKVVISGESYGGYMAAMALTYGAEYFQYGVAKYGVMDWALYDSHYTERYMDRPQDNPEGYRFASVLTHVANYQTHGPAMLYIEHGLMDDNVHMQNSLQLVDTLQHLNKSFELMLFPNERHGWMGVKGDFTSESIGRFMDKYIR